MPNSHLSSSPIVSTTQTLLPSSPQKTFSSKQAPAYALLPLSLSLSLSWNQLFRKAGAYLALPALCLSLSFILHGSVFTFCSHSAFSPSFSAPVLQKDIFCDTLKKKGPWINTTCIAWYFWMGHLLMLQTQLGSQGKSLQEQMKAAEIKWKAFTCQALRLGF